MKSDEREMIKKAIQRIVPSDDLKERVRSAAKSKRRSKNTIKLKCGFNAASFIAAAAAVAIATALGVFFYNEGMSTDSGAGAANQPSSQTHLNGRDDPDDEKYQYIKEFFSAVSANDPESAAGLFEIYNDDNAPKSQIWNNIDGITAQLLGECISYPYCHFMLAVTADDPELARKITPILPDGQEQAGESTAVLVSDDTQVIMTTMYIGDENFSPDSLQSHINLTVEQEGEDGSEESEQKSCTVIFKCDHEKDHSPELSITPDERYTIELPTADAASVYTGISEIKLSAGGIMLRCDLTDNEIAVLEQASDDGYSDNAADENSQEKEVVISVKNKDGTITRPDHTKYSVGKDSIGAYIAFDNICAPVDYENAQSLMIGDTEIPLGR